MGDTLEYLESEFPDEPEQWGGSVSDITDPIRTSYGWPDGSSEENPFGCFEQEEEED